MNTYPKLHVPKPRKGLKWFWRSRSLVATRPTIARNGRIVRRVTLVFRPLSILYRRVPAALPLPKRGR